MTVAAGGLETILGLAHETVFGVEDQIGEDLRKVVASPQFSLRKDDQNDSSLSSSLGSLSRPGDQVDQPGISLCPLKPAQTKTHRKL